MKIVADTGPMIGLAKIGQIQLLKKLATDVLIAPVVHKELYGKIGPESEQIDQALDDFVHGYWLSDEILAVARKLAEE